MNKLLYIEVLLILEKLHLHIYPYKTMLHIEDKSLVFEITDYKTLNKGLSKINRKYLPIIIVNNETIYITIETTIDKIYNKIFINSEIQITEHPHDPELYKAIAFNSNQLNKLENYIKEFFSIK